MRRIRIGLLGCGNVGRGFVELLARERERVRARHGVDLHIHRILVREPERARSGVARSLLTTSAVEVIDGPCDVVVELVGGVHSAGSFVRRAIDRGRDVVTANKALLALSGDELLRAAGARGVQVLFEGAVCAGMPVVRALRHGLAGDSIESLSGILNGTTNYVLTRMDEGSSFAEAVALAQANGFAEADPTLDTSGEDAMQKLTILASLAFDVPVVRTSVVGISETTRAEVAAARHRGRILRSVAEARRAPGGVALSVAPRELDPADALARVRDEGNAVVIHARAAGELAFYGKGAGAMPTAAAVLGDVIEVARRESVVARRGSGRAAVG